jgi:hypothetical protein
MLEHRLKRGGEFHPKRSRFGVPIFDIRTMLQRGLLRISEPKGTPTKMVSGAVLDLTFAMGSGGDTEADIKSAALEARPAPVVLEFKVY